MALSWKKNPYNRSRSAWCRALLFDFDGGATVARMDHCPFKDDSRQYYYPIVTSTVEDVHYNCFYPGMGPGGQNEVNAGNNVSSVCDGSPASLNCCAVYSGVDPFCCNGIAEPKLRIVV